jgi:hypothetical protein
MKISIAIVIIILFISGCKKSDDNRAITYTDYSIYLTTDSLVNTNLTLNDLVIEKTPFIKYSDIKCYDSVNHILELNRRINTIFNYNSGLDGRGFVAILNNEVKVFCGVLWSPIHSISNQNIMLTLPMDDKSSDSCLIFIEGYPNTNYDKGYSIVNDKRIIELFKKDKKIK